MMQLVSTGRRIERLNPTSASGSSPASTAGSTLGPGGECRRPSLTLLYVADRT